MQETPTLARSVDSAVFNGWTSFGSYQDYIPQTTPWVPEIVRTYTGIASWGFWSGASAPTAAADVDVVLSELRIEDEMIAQLHDFRNLREGWDGENAAAPLGDAINDAIRFVSAAGALSARLEPSIHVDGSILLEIDSGAEGSFRFNGDSKVVYSTVKGGFGSAPVNRYTLPWQIKLALFE